MKRRGLILALLCLFCAAILSSAAQDYAKRQMIQEWEASHRPSILIWEKTLYPYGYEKVRDARILHQVLAKIPASLDAAGNAWITENKDWICIFMEATEDIPITVFKTRHALAELKHPVWQKQGTGWFGLERTLADLNRIPPLSRPRAAPLDPREIRY